MKKKKKKQRDGEADSVDDHLVYAHGGRRFLADHSRTRGDCE